MKTKVGLWIDHRKAVVVTITGGGEELGLKITKVVSEVEKQLRRAGDSPLKGSYDKLQLPPEDSRKRALMGHLNIYYDAVIASIRSAESILIFGPGPAKDELRKRLVKNDLGARIVGVEAADKMTDPQIATRVRKHFVKTAPWQVNNIVTKKRVMNRRTSE
ncbi:MAG: hypothetical protein A2X45_05375 [Lentisphaerae bacterium GWF2_50_93]|nr:MAG: hypothetical protein A2X45_05375 [Lentisphaerae bacterium GWF2_50_93]